MFNGFMGKYAVQLRNGGFEIGFENIDKGVIGPLTQQIVAGLSGDAAADRFGVAAVAAAGAFDAQLQRGEDGDGNAYEHQCYHSMCPVAEWEEHIAKKRHGNNSNYLFADGHAAPHPFHETVGDGTAKQNRHFVKEWCPDYL